MAGHTTLGIRLSSGKEYWMCVYAKGMFEALLDPDFQNEGQSVIDLIEKAKHDTWNISIIKKPKLYSYGYTVVDFINKTIYSRQGYANINPIIIGGEAAIKLLGKFKKAKYIDNIITPYSMEKISYSKSIEYLKEYPYSYVHVFVNGPLKINHNCKICDKEGAIDVSKWTKSKGWLLKTSKD